MSIDRILDNLPLVVPIPRHDQDNSLVYQHGFHVGLRGQYAGVSFSSLSMCPTPDSDVLLTSVSLFVFLFLFLFSFHSNTEQG